MVEGAWLQTTKQTPYILKECVCVCVCNTLFKYAANDSLPSSCPIFLQIQPMLFVLLELPYVTMLALNHPKANDIA